MPDFSLDEFTGGPSSSTIPSLSSTQSGDTFSLDDFTGNVPKTLTPPPSPPEEPLLKRASDVFFKPEGMGENILKTVLTGGVNPDIMGSVIGAPAKAMDWIAQKSAGLAGLPQAPESTIGQMVRSGLGFNQGYETSGYGSKIAGKGIEFLSDMARDPLTWTGFGLKGTAGKVASTALATLMAKGTLEEGKRAYDTFLQQGLSPEVAEQLIGTVLSAGMTGMAGMHAVGEKAPSSKMEAPLETKLTPEAQFAKDVEAAAAPPPEPFKGTSKNEPLPEGWALERGQGEKAIVTGPDGVRITYPNEKAARKGIASAQKQIITKPPEPEVVPLQPELAPGEEALPNVWGGEPLRGGPEPQLVQWPGEGSTSALGEVPFIPEPPPQRGIVREGPEPTPSASSTMAPPPEIDFSRIPRMDQAPPPRRVRGSEMPVEEEGFLHPEEQPPLPIELKASIQEAVEGFKPNKTSIKEIQDRLGIPEEEAKDLFWRTKKALQEEKKTGTLPLESLEAPEAVLGERLFPKNVNEHLSERTRREVAEAPHTQKFARWAENVFNSAKSAARRTLLGAGQNVKEARFGGLTHDPSRLGARAMNTNARGDVIVNPWRLAQQAVDFEATRRIPPGTAHRYFFEKMIDTIAHENSHVTRGERHGEKDILDLGKGARLREEQLKYEDITIEPQSTEEASKEFSHKTFTDVVKNDPTFAEQTRGVLDPSNDATAKQMFMDILKDSERMNKEIAEGKNRMTPPPERRRYTEALEEPPEIRDFEKKIQDELGTIKGPLGERVKREEAELLKKMDPKVRRAYLRENYRAKVKTERYEQNRLIKQAEAKFKEESSETKYANEEPEGIGELPEAKPLQFKAKTRPEAKFSQGQSITGTVSPNIKEARRTWANIEKNLDLNKLTPEERTRLKQLNYQAHDISWEPGKLPVPAQKSLPGLDWDTEYQEVQKLYAKAKRKGSVSPIKLGPIPPLKGVGRESERGAVSLGKGINANVPVPPLNLGGHPPSSPTGKALSITNSPSLGSKVLNEMKEFSAGVRAFTVGGDVSSPFRQSWIQTFAHPVKSAKNFEVIFRGLSESGRKNLAKEIEASPYFKDAEKLKIVNLKEEQYVGTEYLKKRLGKHVGGVFESTEGGYNAYLNKTRMDTFSRGMELLEGKYGKGKVPENVKRALGDYTLSSTGRGVFKSAKMEAAATELNKVLFSPRLLKSRIDTLNPAHWAKMWKESPEVAKMAAMDLVRATAFVGSIVGGAAAAGAKVEKDPRSTDFGKIRVGQTSIDPWGGYQPYVRLAAQIATGQRKTQYGKIQNVKLGDLLQRFARSKLAPLPGAAWTAYEGKNYVGERASLTEGKTYWDTFGVMTLRDINEIAKQDPVLATALALPIALGIGTTTREPISDNPKIQKEYLRLNVPPPMDVETIEDRSKAPEVDPLTGKQKYQRRTLSNEEFRRVKEEGDKMSFKEIEKFISSEAYQKLSDEQKRIALNKISRSLGLAKRKKAKELLMSPPPGARR